VGKKGTAGQAIGTAGQATGTTGQTTDKNIIRRLRFACWITKPTDTHSEYVILIALQQEVAQLVEALR